MNPTAPTTPTTWRERAPWWLLLPFVCHWAFSWIGFSPTDDGWLQAVARRLLDGEVPHRDFIFVRPALSAYLQVPLVALGGDHVIWLSRLWGWLTVAVICWLWTGLVDARGAVRYALYAIAVMLTAHTFPVMAWHTFDALLLCTIAVRLARDGRLKAAFFAAGTAALCRQNFAFFAPLLLVAVGGPWRFWFVAGFWSALPALLYGAAIAALGGGRDFVLQIAAAGGQFKEAALERLFFQPWWWAGLAGGAALLAARRKTPPAAAVGWLVLGLGLASALAWMPRTFHLASFALLGVVAVAGLGSGSRLLAVTGPALAWVTMISLGYNNPALMAGALFVLAWRILAAELPEPAGRRVLVGLLVVVIATAAALTRARLQYPYRDEPARQLAWPAGDVLPGAAGLRTNVRVISTLAELRQLTLEREAAGVPYAILTDVSAHWIHSRQRNLLAVDWPQETELGFSPALFDRFFREMTTLPANTDLIVQKFLIADYVIAFEPVDLTWRYYFAQNYVRLNCRKKGETRFFEIYAKPDVYPPVGPPRPVEVPKTR